jgi:hypothetical protein
MAMTTKSKAVRIAVLANDSDPDGDRLTVISATAPARGMVVINADGTVTYTPSARFDGTDTFGYTVSDGRGGTASAIVTVTATVSRPARGERRHDRLGGDAAPDRHPSPRGGGRAGTHGRYAADHRHASPRR